MCRWGGVGSGGRGGFLFPCSSPSPASPCCLLQDPNHQLIQIIEETTSTECRQEVANNLLKLFLGQGLAKDFLDLLFQLELSRTSETWEELVPGRVEGVLCSRLMSPRESQGLMNPLLGAT